LTNESRNNKIGTYKVWNLNSNRVDPWKEFKQDYEAFHAVYEKEISLEELLSSDAESMRKFDAIRGIKRSQSAKEKPIEYLVVNKLILVNQGAIIGDIYKIEKWGEDNPTS